jgi:hypothetical protein
LFPRDPRVVESEWDREEERRGVFKSNAMVFVSGGENGVTGGGDDEH